MTETDQTTDTKHVSLGQALAELAAGDTGGSVASVLLAFGITGRKGDAYDCPVARYLRLRTGRTDIGVAPRGIFQVLGDCLCGKCSSKSYGKDPIMPIPRVVADFILTFDGVSMPPAYRSLVEA